MRVIGIYYLTFITFGERYHNRISPQRTAGYRVFEVQEAYASLETEDKNKSVVIRSGHCKCRIRMKNGDPLTDELANSLVRDIATKDIVDLDEYDMALFEHEVVSIPVRKDKLGTPLRVKIINSDDNKPSE